MKNLLALILCVAFLGLIARAGEPDTKNNPPIEKKSSVIEGWGTVVDVGSDCTVKGDSTKVTITVPDTTHDLNTGIAMNAPRVLREVEGDFTATVKVTGEFKPGEKSTNNSGYPFNGAGLLIWSDEKNCVRLERNIWWMPGEKKSACYTPLFQYFKAGEEQPGCPGGTTQPFFKGDSTWFRLERKDDHVAAFYSHDGKEWTAVKEIAVDLPKKVQVGIAAINTSDKVFTVEFTEFKVEAGKDR